MRPVQRLYPLELSTNEHNEISEEFLKQYKRSSDTGKSIPEPQHKKENDTDETPERREDGKTERRTRSGRKVITPKKLLGVQ